MRQDELKPPLNSRHNRKQVGRGNGSGHGTYSSKGCKGQKSRSGGAKGRGFEGGQLPLIQKLPRKRGFTNIFKIKYAIVNVGELKVFPQGTEVDIERLYQERLVRSPKQAVKILSEGEIHHSLVIRATEFSSAAEGKILAAGGKVERI
jgi:large subunit ribosomal protein L15